MTSEMNCLSKGALTEIKNLNHPPEGVKRVVYAMAAVFGVAENW